MSHVIPNLNRYTLRVLLVFIFISGYLAYSSIDSTVYTTEQLVVVPGQVETDGWSNLDSVLITDLSGEALYQEFNTNNSAVIITTPATSPDTTSGVSSLPEASESSSTDSGAESLNESDSSDSESSSTGPDSETSVSTEEEPAAVEEEVAPPVPADAPVSTLMPEPSFTVVTTTERYPWAQLSETVAVEAPT
ncbi:MAG: hypothetical protein MUF19_01450, partial [Candidatus Pacebacteria bacterium]|nr:hypothetical protein [Candidatus Paceibacterota bacterium]